MTEGGKEIVRHAVIGGLVMAVLLTADLLNHAYGRPDLLATFSGIWILIVVAGFALAFALIGIVERVWYNGEIAHKRWRDQQKIQLAGDIGIVDGTWIDVIWKASDTEPEQTSIIEITSTVGGGFKVRGHTFDVSNLNKEKGKFTSDVTQTMVDQRGVMYQYIGQEANPSGGPAIGHSGLGFYNFHKAASGQLEFSGAFMATVEHGNRRVEGRILSESQTDAFSFLLSTTKKDATKEQVAKAIWQGFIDEKRATHSTIPSNQRTRSAITAQSGQTEMEEDG